LTTLALALPNLQQMMLPILLIGFVYLFVLAPQKKQKAWTERLSKIKSGDQVITTGGIRGTVVSLGDDVMQLRIAPDNIKLEFSKSAIASVTTADDVTTTK
jgi:preprotein translocase subunit YajC